MIRRMILISCTATLLGCSPDETISGFAKTDTTYVLTSLNGTAFVTRATINFPQEGMIAGAAPCNSYSAAQTAPYPWFAVGPIAATRMACAELAAETDFFEALAAMSIAEVNGPILLLSNITGAEMVFQAE